MEYVQCPTRPPLSRWVRAFWNLRSGGSDVGAAESVFPDGCVDVRRSDPLVETASRIIRRSGGRVTVDRLSREVGVRPRRLERRFRVHVGIAPKKLCRITRFQHLLGELASGTLAGAAFRCGYSDQAHLTRDFRDFTGVTPAAFRDGDDVLPRLFAGLPVGA